MKCAIVGAGIGGLSAAAFLLDRDPTLEIEVFERETRVGGRMATHRTMNGVWVDTACQFLSMERGPVHDFFFEHAPESSVRELPQSILCLPEGFVVESAGRFFLPEGMNQLMINLVAALQKRSPAFKLHLGRDIGSLAELEAAGFERVLVTVPGTDATTRFGSKRAVEYHPCLTLVFSWHQPPRDALEFYAFRDISSREGITWLAHEGLKRGTPGVWVAQVSAQASQAWYRELKGDEAFEDRLTADLATWIPAFAEGEKSFLTSFFWPQAFPIQFGDAESPSFERGASHGKIERVYYLGDGYRGVGRAENAIESALATAEDFFRPDPPASPT